MTTLVKPGEIARRRGLNSRRRGHASQKNCHRSLRMEPLEDRRLLGVGLGIEWSTYLMGDPGWHNGATAVALNEEGSIFVSTSSNVSDCSVAKISADGQNEIWKSIFKKGNGALPVSTDMAVDANDNVFITGAFAMNGTVPDAHVTKLDAWGAKQWTWSLSERDYPDVDTWGVAVASGEEYVYVTGGKHDDILLVKLRVNQANSPELVWSKTYGGSGGDIAYDIALDSSGNVVLGGETDSVDFASDGFDTVFGGGRSDAFVMKLSPDGAREPQWLRA